MAAIGNSQGAGQLRKGCVAAISNSQGAGQLRKESVADIKFTLPFLSFPASWRHGYCPEYSNSPFAPFRRIMGSLLKSATFLCMRRSIMARRSSNADSRTIAATPG